MSYLKEKDIIEIQNEVKLLSIKEIDNISNFMFDCQTQEYNHFLQMADKYYDLNISKTFLLIHRKTNELLAYMTLSADSVKLSKEEKELHEIGKVPYASLPALKIGKLAVNKAVTEKVRRKGYGSFMIEVARAFACSMNDLGIACRFITVDADIEYDENTPTFYVKNGFVENLKNKTRNLVHTISMRKDILVEE